MPSHRIILKKLLLHSKRPYFFLFKRKFKIDFKHSVFLFTSGRGGGTWLMEIFANELNLFKVFEPFAGTKHYEKYKELTKDNMDCIKNTSCYFWQLTKEYLDKCFNGNILQGSHFYMNQLQLPGLKKSVVKFVNRTIIIPLFLESYELNYPVCLLVRNPIDILQSRLNYSTNSKVETHHRKSIKDLESVFHYYKAFHYLLKEINTNFELEVFYLLNEWAYVIEKTKETKMLVVVKYEDLKEQGMNKSKELLSNVYGISNITTKKSASTKRLIKAGVNKSLTDDQKTRLKYIINEFSKKIPELSWT